MRKHWSEKGIVLDVNRKYYQDFFKPRGLWYEIDNGWKDWVHYESPDWENEYQVGQEVVFKPGARVLVLDSVDVVRKFIETYSTLHPKLRSDEIDWVKVTQEWDAVEIPDYGSLWDPFRYDSSWFYAWDCSSGCVWNLDVVEVR